MKKSKSGSSQRDALRNELIGATVRGAASNSAFYRQHFEGCRLSRISTIGDLAELPTLTKNDVRTAGLEMLCDGQTPSHVQYTSGSTGAPLLLFRSQEELGFIRSFFHEVQDVKRSRDARPIVLSLSIPHHGTPTPIPSQAFVLQSAITDDELLEQTIVLIENTFKLPQIESKVSAIVGSFSQIIALTNILIENHRFDIMNNITHVELTGDYLTPRWRKVLENFWQCRVLDRYSLAEIFGGATYCDRRNGYHFDPYVIPELVTPNSETVAKPNQVGELVLTSLNPFIQYQPFIRYRTGDLFISKSSDNEQECWEFRGRTSHALFDPNDTSAVLIDGRAVLDGVDNIPEVSRPARYADLKHFGYTKASGRPKFNGKVEMRDQRVFAKLRIQLDYAPDVFPSVTKTIKDAIRNAVLTESPQMRRAIQHRGASFEVECVPPGTLSEVHKSSSIWDLN